MTIARDGDRFAVRVNGDPVDPDATYRLATPRYVLVTDREFPTLTREMTAGTGDPQYEVVVMYAGRVVERASTSVLFEAPRHHYTAGLLRSVPGFDAGTEEQDRLQEIQGMVPALHELPVGCRFQDRCPAVQQRCRQEEPELVRVGSSDVRCHFPVGAAPVAESENRAEESA
jgi:oligopeptide/dipeptide ABC transporter ATP-binding protein